MEQQIAVVDLVKTALGIQEPDVPLEFFGMTEGIGELVDHVAFFRCQIVGVFRIDGGEIAVFQRVDLAADVDGFGSVIDSVQQQPVAHAEFGAAQQLLALQLEEDDGNGLVHPGGQQLVLFGIVFCVSIGELDLKAAGITVLVDFVGKNGQWPQGNAIAGFDYIQIVVADGIGKHRGDQSPGAGGGTHPQNIVVTPLNVHAMAVHQAVHNDVSPGAPVENIADDVQMVAGQRLDDMAQCLDHIGCLADFNDGADDVFVLILLGAVLISQVDQLIDDLPVALGHMGAHQISGMLDAHIPANLHQQMDGIVVPGVQVFLFIGDQCQLGGRVVDQCCQLILFFLGEPILKGFIQLVADFAGTGVEDMQKCFMLTVDIRHEMLRTLGQIQNGLQLDDLCTGRLDGGIPQRKKLQIPELVGGEIHMGVQNAFLLLNRDA